MRVKAPIALWGTRCLLLFQFMLTADSNSIIKPFSLADVQLLHVSEFRANMDINLKYLLMLDVDRLAYNFRRTAGLNASGSSYGGWEDSNVEVRGQFMGHFLKAMAYAYQNTGITTYKDRAAQFVSALREVQEAFGDGYLSAFPREHFDRLENLQPVWAPYYVIHKIMAGLLAQHQLTGNPHALGMVEQMAAYFCSRVEEVVARRGEDHWWRVLDNEFGGMNEVLYDLHMETGRARYARCAHRFDKPAFFGAMMEGRDILDGLHANTHLAQANGFGARYMATGDPQAQLAVRNFFRIVLQHHSFSTGGNNWYEHWHPPDTLGDAITNGDASLITEESCTQYNILKVARYLFQWSGEAALADFYERAILNDVIGIQRIDHHHDHHHHHRHHAHPDAPHHELDDTDVQGVARQSVQRGMGGGQPRHSPGSRAKGGGLQRGATDTPRQHTIQRLLAERGGGQAREGLSPGGPGVWEGLSPGGAGVWEGQGGGAGAVDAAAMSAAYAARPRPDNHQVVSWPDDPGRGFVAAGNATRPIAPGQYIYYMPLGSGVSKGVRGPWAQWGWGDPFHTFWCCYGTAVESLSKLADSIYFHRTPREVQLPEDGVEGKRGSVEGDAGGAAATAAHGTALPELFINQLVSSELRWRELGVTIRMEADLYGPTTAAMVRLSMHTSSNHSGGGNGWQEEGLPSPSHPRSGRLPRFYVHWRVPSWMGDDGMELSLNGLPAPGGLAEVWGDPIQGQRAPGGIPMGAALGNDGNGGDGGSGETALGDGWAPPFGHGARYLRLGPHWGEGDVLEARLPMRVAVEGLNDGREEMRRRRAIMMGPFLMAGLTDGANDVVADPDHIKDLISLPSTEDLVTLEACAPGVEGGSAEGLDQDTGAFRLVLTQRGETETPGALSLVPRADVLASRATRMEATFRKVPPLRVGTAWEGGGGSAGEHSPREAFSLESMAYPGVYVAADEQQEGLVLKRVGTAEEAGAATFVISHAEGGADAVAFSGFHLAPLDSPDSSLRLRPAGAEHSVQLPTTFRLAPPAAPSYPPGSRLLSGGSRSYIIAPIGQLIDERYTAYFDFNPPANPATLGRVGVGDGLARASQVAQE